MYIKPVKTNPLLTNTQKPQDNFSNLPDEMIVNIFEYLTKQDLFRAERTNKHILAIATDKHFYKKERLGFSTYNTPKEYKLYKILDSTTTYSIIIPRGYIEEARKEAINHNESCEIVDKTSLSYTFVKKTLDKLKEEEYCGFHYEQSGSTWIAWKDRDHIIKQLNDTCGHMLKE